MESVLYLLKLRNEIFNTHTFINAHYILTIYIQTQTHRHIHTQIQINFVEHLLTKEIINNYKRFLKGIRAIATENKNKN